MTSKKDIIQTSTGPGSMILVVLAILSGNMGMAGSDTLEPRITDLEKAVGDSNVQIASLVSDVKHNENLMEKQAEKYDRIYDLLLQLCQGMTATNGQQCTT